MTLHAEALGAPVTFHGEGPFWDAPRQRLLVMDMLAGAVVETGAGIPPRRHEFGGIAAVIRPRTRGGFVLAVERGIRILDDDLAPTSEPRLVFDDAAMRMNEGGCDPAGRLFVGTMAYDVTPGAGALWCFDPDGGVRTVLHGVTISNGLQWSPDGAEAFYNDTGEARVSRFAVDPDTGQLGERSTFTDLADAPGAPDGMAVDEEGGLWIALWGGSAVHRFDAGGRLSEVVALPCSNVTSCTFGGPDLQTLYITTSRDQLPGDQPQAGAVFAVETGVRGAAQHAFAG